jgi:hypothetical protein
MQEGRPDREKDPTQVLTMVAAVLNRMYSFEKIFAQWGTHFQKSPDPDTVKPLLSLIEVEMGAIAKEASALCAKAGEMRQYLRQ